MRWSIARLTRGRLAALTGLYWLGLGLVKVLPPFLIGWRLTHLTGVHGTIDAGFTNSFFHVTMTEAGRVVWTGSAYLAVILGWMVGPPALLAAARWSARKTAAEEEARAAVAAAGAPAELAAPSLADRLSETDRERFRQRRAARGKEE